jgi:putative ABC transport system permease protein
VFAGNWFVGLDTMARGQHDVFDALVFIQGADGVPGDELLAAVKGVADRYHVENVNDIVGFKESQAAMFKTMVNVVYGLLGLAIFIALLGIANTLALSVHERTRELGLLRAVGMTRPQVRSTVRWESVLIALLGTALGIAIGLVFGWVLSRALRSQGFTQFSIPFVSLLWICALAAVAGVVAAIWPARRAARLNVLAAIATE